MSRFEIFFLVCLGEDEEGRAREAEERPSEDADDLAAEMRRKPGTAKPARLETTGAARSPSRLAFIAVEERPV